jgi:cyclase
MLCKRIIPCLDVNNGRVVKGVNFVNLRDAGDPVENALFYDQEGADELTFLDITASSDKRKIILNLVEKVAAVIHIPFCVGGGISSASEVGFILEKGADKVSINTAAFRKPQIIEESARIFGSQCLVLAIDARKNKEQNYYEVFLHGGRTATGQDAIEWAKKAEGLGAGEILLTSMDRDGTKAGYDIELTAAIAEQVTIPVIASGGVGNPQHMVEGLLKTRAQAVLAASIFHYREYSIRQVKEILKENGIPVRMLHHWAL